MTVPEKVVETTGISVLLIDDQLIVAEALKRMLKDEKDIAIHYCSDPKKAVDMAAQVHPTVILQDLTMPDIDGLDLLGILKGAEATKYVPIVVLSAHEEPTTKAKAFALGANDYLVKLPDRIEMIARVRYHSAAYQRLIDRNTAYRKLEESKRALQQELDEAAVYVTSLLPPPLTNDVTTNWKFIPSAQLGGDAFGYHWIDSDNFAFYLLDVCGHGVGAALLSVSILNVLRNPKLLQADLVDPSSVLKALNLAFPMDEHNNMFSTIWYGVFHRKTRQLRYATGGHPPAVLLEGAERQELRTDGPVIGVLCDATYSERACQLDKEAKLFLYSDGVYEIEGPDGVVSTLNDFIESIGAKSSVAGIIAGAEKLSEGRPFVDDVSVLEIIFH